VRCPGCGEENPARFRLCGFCGTALQPVPETVHCPSCGEENPGKFRLCGFCGAALAGGPPPPAHAIPPPAPAAPMVPVIELPAHEVRKVVTLLFSDLKDSTALTASIDAEAMNEIKARYFASMAAEIERHGGNVEKNIGDAIMAVFGRIKAHEDDALRAVRAAAGMQAVLAQLNEELLRIYGVKLTNRTGVNTGELVVNTDPAAVQNLATGEAVNVAARLEQNAPADQVLLGQITYDLVRQHVEVERIELQMKGYADPVPAFRLLGVRDAPVEEATSVRNTTLVGREDELRTLRSAFAAALDSQGPRLVTVIGEPGVGKSRLVKEFVGELLSEALVLRGRCLPYGDGITFWPLSEIARGAAGIEQEDSPEQALEKLSALLPPVDDRDAIVDRVAAAINLSPARFPVAELYWGGRRFLEVLGQTHPVVVIVDDIHSAEATFLEFLEHILDASQGVPILLLCTARHALLERQPEWSERAGAERVQLGPLGASDTAALVTQLLGDAGLADEVQAKVVAAAEGNPLFVEQLVSMLVDKGLLRREGDRWVPAQDMADLAIPPTIQALLVSRLDDLTREERAVVEPASVIGLVFFQPAVEEMVPVSVRPLVPVELGALDEKQFVAREAGDEDEEAYRFRHILIRDATYGSLLKRARAQLHERFVAWAERINRERGREQEFEEIHGYHLEQAFRYRSELGPIDAAGRDVATRAATKLGNAGQRAFARGDLPAAQGLLTRAAALLEQTAPKRVELLTELAETLVERGDFEGAMGVIADAEAAARALDDERLLARVRIASLWKGMFSGSGSDGGADEAEIARLAGRLEEHEDWSGAARAWRLHMLVQQTAGRNAAAAESARRVADAARRGDDVRMVARGSIGYATATLNGPTPVAEALGECESLLAEVRGDRRTEGTILSITAVFHAMEGRFDEARDRLDRGRSLIAELGPSLAASTTSLEASRVYWLARNLDAAEAVLRRDHDDLAALDERYYRSTIAGLLSRVLVEAGKTAEAGAFADITRDIADPDDTVSQVLWRQARAILAARGGDADTAERLATEAVMLVAPTQEVELAADAYADLAEVLHLAGRDDEAGPPAREALLRYQQKGNAVSGGRLREKLGEAAPV